MISKRFAAKRLAALLAAAVAAASAFAETGMMLRADGSIKVRSERGMEWADNLPFGTQLEVVDETPVEATYYWTGGHSAKPVPFYRVSWRGKDDYYVNASEFAFGGTPAVVTEDATLFTKPRVSQFRNAYLDPGTLALATGRTTSSGAANFSEITFFDTLDRLLRTRWVQTSKLSTEANDVKAAQLVELARMQKTEELKKKQVSNALDVGSSGRLKDYVQAEYNRIFGIFTEDDFEDIGADGSSAPFWTGTIHTKDGSKINVRAVPGMGGEAVGQLPDGAPVTVTRRTKRADRIDGINERWYYVDPQQDIISGWVFGGYILPAADPSAESGGEEEIR